jgi:hypothetical protein
MVSLYQTSLRAIIFSSFRNLLRPLREAASAVAAIVFLTRCCLFPCAHSPCCIPCSPASRRQRLAKNFAPPRTTLGIDIQRETGFCKCPKLKSNATILWRNASPPPPAQCVDFLHYKPASHLACRFPAPASEPLKRLAKRVACSWRNSSLKRPSWRKSALSRGSRAGEGARSLL